MASNVSQCMFMYICQFISAKVDCKTTSFQGRNFTHFIVIICVLCFFFFVFVLAPSMLTKYFLLISSKKLRHVFVASYY